MSVMGVYKTVRIVWYHFSECVCVSERERDIQNIKRFISSLGGGITYMTSVYSFILFCVFRIFCIEFILFFIIKKRETIFFP